MGGPEPRSTVEGMLETDRLLLRPWRAGEAGIQRELWAERDPRVPPHRRLDADGRPTLAELEDGIRAGRRPGLLAIEVRATGDVVGYCGLLPNEHGQDDEPELAYELLRRAWGHGYATEAGRAVVDDARASGHRRLWATVRSWNEPSFRVLARLGFVVTDRVEPDPVHGDSVFARLDL